MAHPVEHLGGGRGLDDLAGVHDEDTVGPAGDDTHVVGDEHDGHVEALPEVVEEIEDLGLDGDVEGGGGLVGDQELRLAGQGHGDHDPLAQSARELVGIGVQPFLGPGHVHQREDLEGAVPGLALEALRCSRTLSEICRPMVMVGLREVRGSWKIMPTSLPRILHISFSPRGTRSRPSRLIFPPVTWPTLGRSFMIERPVVVFPQPDSPTTPTHSPWSTWKETSSTATTFERRRWNSVRRPSTSRTALTGDRLCRLETRSSSASF